MRLQRCTKSHLSIGRLHCAGRVGIFSGNTVEWMLAMQAGNYYSIYIGEFVSNCHRAVGRARAL